MAYREKYQEIQCKTACHKINSPFLPYHWDLNIYRGCSHGCKYCYALYSHAYLQAGAPADYFQNIFVKANIVERLEEQLRKPSWKREIINIGGVTDSYQPLEKQYQLMPDILKLLMKYKTPCIISTKSDLILRDYDLLLQLAEIVPVHVATTITCFQNNLQQKLEPGACSTTQRLAVLRAFAPTKVITGMHIMPIIPYLADNLKNLEPLYAAAQEMGVTYVLPGLLNLKGPTRIHFLEFIQKQFPKIYYPLFALYQPKNKEMKKQYRASFYPLIFQLEKKYEIKRDVHCEVMNQKNTKDYEQLSLFGE